MTRCGRPASGSYSGGPDDRHPEPLVSGIGRRNNAPRTDREAEGTRPGLDLQPRVV